MGKGKRNPWHGADDFWQHVERMLDEGRGGMNPATATGYLWTPLADVLETPQAFIIQVELPGVTAEMLLVEIVDNDLVVRGERPCARSQEREEPEPAYHLMERAHGAFARRFPLPPGLDGQNVTARMIEGVLTISLPKARAKSPARFSLHIG